MECAVNENKKKCTCTYEPCPRKGNCCQCVAYHRQFNEVPGCFFPPEAEKTYDRSIARLAAAYKL
ncbi:DUF6485 family protein [Calderihabitans maritimus]|uniref:Cytosolic protein n=1 Tax=Calderihabitans maritimus TaxID=1246530 RepID=A0A1Z5HQT5_9FIRM|nr:DUF6485 family protein [Calderihabitans maritimus]GAW91874.1 hypothetical protein Desku_2116 [Calderihabitans maritimus]